MQMKYSLIAALLIAAIALPSVRAEDIAPPSRATFEVQLDVAAIRDTDVGAKLIHAIRLMAAEEMEEDLDADRAFEALEDALGFDPIDEARSVRIFAESFEDPQEGMQAIVEMRSTTGNLEGLLLALPGYQSSDHGDNVIHSVALVEDFRIFGAIHGDRYGKSIVVGTDEDDVIALLDSLGDRRSSGSSDDGGRRSRDSAPLVTVRLLEIPEITDVEGPPEALLKLIEAATIHIRESGEEIVVEIDVDSDTEKHAEQIFQLAQGGAAMVALASDSEEDDEELKILARVLETLDAAHDEKSVRLRVKLPQDLVIAFLREEVELPIEE